MIKVENLYKTFKTTSEEKSLFGKKKIDFHAVKNLNFEVEEGQVLSLLGPNGCGKTTTLRMIAGMLEPAKGTAFIDGMDVRIHKQEIKSLIEDSTLLPKSLLSVINIDWAFSSCSAWAIKSEATHFGSFLESATTTISEGPAIKSMPTSPKTCFLAAAT